MADRIPDSLAGARLDQALARVFCDYSRSRITRWIRDGQVRVDGKCPRPKDVVRGGEWVEIHAEFEPAEEHRPEPIPLDIVYEDESLIVVNKPVGLVVHPAAGNWEGTLQNALLHHDPALASLPRAGLVHRLDKDTTGLLVVARSLAAHKSLVAQLQARTVRREYEALVQGEVIAGGCVEAPVGRHPTDRKRMAVVPTGKPATTHYRVVERFRGHTWLRAWLETGRTHQIRVHMAHLGHPLVGDRVYGGRPKPPPGATDALREALKTFPRQALHAGALGLAHPVTGQPLAWQAPLPEDMAGLIAVLRADREG